MKHWKPVANLANQCATKFAKLLLSKVLLHIHTEFSHDIQVKHVGFCKQYRIEGHFGGCRLRRINYKTTLGNISFGKSECL